MNKIKLFSIAAIICAMATTSYRIYQNATMTEQERMIQANLEALTIEGEDGSSSSWTCWSSQKEGAGYWRCGNPCVWVNGFEGKSDKGTCYSY